MFFNKSATFSFSALLALCGGQTYSFSDYSEALQAAPLRLTDTQLQGLQTCLTTGSYFGIPAGMLYDRIKHKPRLGPRLILLVGIVCNFVGYYFFWGSATGKFSAPFWMMCMFALVAGNGGTWFDASLVVTNVLNNPGDRGFVVGALKSFVGLGAGVSTQMFKAYYAEKPLGFLLMLAVAPTAIAFIVTIFMNRVPYRQVAKQMNTIGISCSVAVATGILISILVTTSTLVKDLNKGNAKEILFWVIVGMLGPMLLSPFYTGGWISVRNQDDEESQLLQRLTDPTGGAKEGKESEGDNEGLSFGETLKSLDFWLLFICFGTIAGSGLTLLHSLGQLVPALTYGKRTSCTVFVQLFSVCNCFGRIAAGYVSQYLLTKRSTPRTLFIFLDVMLMSLNFMLLPFISIDLLYVPVIICGFAFGCNWSLMPATISELFGAKAFASNYNFIQISASIGDFVLSTALAGHLYDLERRKQHEDGDECYGRACFRKTFMIIAGLTLLCCIASFSLLLRTRKKYKEL
jgi:MFS family permease